MPLVTLNKYAIQKQKYVSLTFAPETPEVLAPAKKLGATLNAANNCWLIPSSRGIIHKILKCIICLVKFIR